MKLTHNNHKHKRHFHNNSSKGTHIKAVMVVRAIHACMCKLDLTNISCVFHCDYEWKTYIYSVILTSYTQH